MTEKINDLIQDYLDRKAERVRLNQLWEEIAEVLSPERIGFTSQQHGNQRQDKIFNTTPNVAKRGLVNAVGSMLRPKSSSQGKWFDIVPEDEDLLDDREVKEWVDFAEEKLWKAMYNPKAQFMQATGEVDDDLITFGTGAGFVGLRKDQSGFRYKSFHLKDILIDVDDDNNPTGVMVSESLTARQAARKWGEENLGQKTKEALDTASPDKDKKFEFIWIVKPRYERDPRFKNNLNMPFLSMVIDRESEHIVIEEGFEEFPFFLPRWDTRSGEIYGRGPGVLALPDTLTLNQMGKTMLRALHRAVDPPWLLPSDSAVKASGMHPGMISYYDAKAIRNLGLSQPFQQMNSDAKIPWALDASQATSERLFAVFFRNVLNLPVEGPEMTATEVIQRREEFVREIGSVFGRLEGDYNGPLVERSFNMMLRRGAFGGPNDIPEAIQGTGITFRFASPVEKAKRQIEESTISAAMSRVLQTSQFVPEILDAYNWDEYAKIIGESNDFPHELLLDQRDIDAKRQQRAEAQAKEMEMQEAERGVAAAAQAKQAGLSEQMEI